jgi:NitT/TauT family transport system substrate-binding protein
MTCSLKYATSLLVLLFFASLPPPSAISGEVSTKPKASFVTAVKMGVPVFGVSLAPYFIAKEKGFYAEEGLKVDFILMPGSVAVTATISGEIEFNNAVGSSIGASMQGLPIKAVLTLSRKPKYWIFSKPDIRSMADMAGRTLAVGTRGGDQHVQTLLLLEKFGFTGKVNVIPMASIAAQAVVNSLISGYVDAGYANESTYFELKDKGFRELVNYGDFLEAPSAGVATSQKLIDTNPGIVQAFVNASYHGMLFFKENRSESIKVMARYMNLDHTSVARAYDLVIDTFGGDGTIPYPSVKKTLQIRKQILNLTAAVTSYEELFDDRFARNLSKQIGGGIAR